MTDEIHDDEDLKEPTVEELELGEKKQARLQKLQEEYNLLIGQAGECQYRIYTMTRDLEELNRKARVVNQEAAGIAREAKDAQAKRAKAMKKRLSRMKVVPNGDADSSAQL